jgi:hypothetical protein
MPRRCGKCDFVFYGGTQCPQCYKVLESPHPSKKPPPMSTQDKMSVEWEKVKHLIPDGELKTFICSAIMLAMEKWHGGEPPKAKPLTVELVGVCDHEFQYTSKGTRCIKCGVGGAGLIEPDDTHPMKISPFTGGWL